MNKCSVLFHPSGFVIKSACVFQFIAATLVLANARPEPPTGYRYPVPAPAFTAGNLGGGLSGGSIISAGGNLGGFSSGGISSGGIATGGIGFGGISSGGYSGGGIGLGGISGGSIGGNLGGVSLSQSSGSLGVTSGLGGGLNLAGGFGDAGGVQVHKHVYVHVAPEDPEEVRQAALIQSAPRQKHYKIIFIKAPSYSAQQQQIIAQQAAQKEEKTLVYVLVKKPESPADITIPAPAAVQPSKPEVYFIR